MIVNKEKQKEDRVQDEEVFLYKPYDISSKYHQNQANQKPLNLNLYKMK